MMFILDFYFGSIFIILCLVLFFLLNLIQLWYVKSSDFSDIYKYLYKLYPVCFKDFNTDLRVLGCKSQVLLIDWIYSLDGCILYFGLLLFVILVQSFMFGYSCYDMFYRYLVLVNMFSSGLMLFCFFLFFMFFLILRFISYIRSFITFEFFFYFLCVIWGIYMVLSVFDLLSIYIFVELQGVCFYVLSGLYNKSFRTVDAGLKYFILGSLASASLLCGFFVIYICSGLFNLMDLFLYCRCCHMYYWFYLALCFISISFLFKLMVFPFHFWALDVYEGSSYIVTFFFLVFSKVSFFYLIWLIFGVIFGSFFCYFKFLFLLCAAGAIIYSTILCCIQINIKRFFICSSYNHIGFILGALSCHTFIGLWSFFLYICIYMLMTFLLWSLLNILYCCKTGAFIYLSDFSGLFYSYTYISFLLVIVLFSMAGLPPFLGFFAKFYVILSLVNSSYTIFSYLFILLSVISAFYYIRVLKYIFIDQTFEIIVFSRIWLGSLLILCLLGCLLSFFFYYSDLVFVMTNLCILFILACLVKFGKH